MCCRCRLYTNPSTSNSYTTSTSYSTSYSNSYTFPFLYGQSYSRYGNGSNWFNDHFNRQCNGRKRNRHPG